MFFVFSLNSTQCFLLVWVTKVLPKSTANGFPSLQVTIAPIFKSKYNFFPSLNYLLSCKEVALRVQLKPMWCQASAFRKYKLRACERSSHPLPNLQIWSEQQLEFIRQLFMTHFCQEKQVTKIRLDRSFSIVTLWHFALMVPLLHSFLQLSPFRRNFTILPIKWQSEQTSLFFDQEFSHVICFGQWDLNRYGMSRSLKVAFLYPLNCLVFLPLPREEHFQVSLLNPRA